MEFDLFLLKSRGIKQGCNFLELSSDAIFNDHLSREGRNLGLKPIQMLKYNILYAYPNS